MKTLKRACENHDVEELAVDRSSLSNLRTIEKSFPKVECKDKG